MFTLVTLGTIELSIRPVKVTVSALVSPKSTLPVAFNNPVVLTVPVNVLAPVTASVELSVVAPVTPSVPAVVVFPVNVLVPVTRRLLPTVTLPLTVASPVVKDDPSIWSLPVPFGFSIKLALVLSVEIVLPANCKLLKLVPPNSS